MRRDRLKIRLQVEMLSGYRAGTPSVVLDVVVLVVLSEAIPHRGTRSL
ncbi:hypothetical protein [Pseudonocardia sp. MH-G8]|nr:hypothetical protein [Pseudonocardia sp. MH-G8]